MSQGSSDIIQSLQASVGCDYFRELVSISAKRIANLIDKTSKAGKIITLFGNGGSAADAQHWAAELVCTYRSRSRQPVPAVALTTDSSILTAWSNDFDFSEVFSRQVRAFSRQNGLSIGISTSGRSPNVCTALNTARSQGAQTILVTGASVEANPLLDIHVILPSTDTPVIQTMTQVLYHCVCEYLE